MEIINEYIKNQLDEENLNSEVYKSQYYDTYRRYYLKNKSKILERNKNYEQTYEKRNELNKVSARTSFYIKKGLFEGYNRTFAKITTTYMIIHKLNIKQLEYAKFCIELLAIRL